jgi:hypothetical protein
MNKKGRDTYLYTIILLAIFILAFGVRLWGIDFGYGLQYHPDEQPKIKDVLIFLNGDTLETTRSFFHPPFMRRFAAFIIGVIQTFTSQNLNISEMLVMSRMSVAFLGALTVIPLYFLGSFLVSRKIGLIAAVILAVVPLHVVTSHYFKEDIPLTFWLVLYVFAGIKLLRLGHTRFYILAGLAGGLALSTKYTAIGLVPVTLLAAHLLSAMGKENFQFSSLKSWIRAFLDSRFWLAFGTMLITFVVTSFDLFMNFNNFITGVTGEYNHVVRGHYGISISSLPLLFTYHLRYSLLPGMTTPLFLMSLGGVLYALWINRKETSMLREISWLLFVLLIFYLTVEIPHLKPYGAERYVLPCVPMLCLFAAWLFLFVKNRAAYFLKASSVVILSSIVLYAGITSARYNAEMVPDTRDDAAQWLYQLMTIERASDETVMLFGLIPKYLPYSIMIPKHMRDRVTLSDSLNTFIEEKPTYFVISSFNYDRYFMYEKHSTHRSERSEQFLIFYKSLFKTHEPAVSFSSSLRRIGFNNPTIFIYRLDYSHPMFR